MALVLIVWRRKTWSDLKYSYCFSGDEDGDDDDGGDDEEEEEEDETRASDDSFD